MIGGPIPKFSHIRISLSPCVCIISLSTGFVSLSFAPKMLCTSMRLTDRRFRIETTVRSNRIHSNTTATITIGTPFVRPCTTIKMFNNVANDANGKTEKTNAPIQERITEANTTNRIQTANGSPDTKNQSNNNNNR